jgi:hypothetical protein
MAYRASASRVTATVYLALLALGAPIATAEQLVLSAGIQDGFTPPTEPASPSPDLGA